MLDLPVKLFRFTLFSALRDAPQNQGILSRLTAIKNGGTGSSER